MNTVLTIAEYLVAVAVGYAIIRFIVLPAIRKAGGTSTGTGSQSPREGKNDRL
jgi:hypothetical protein